jgi:tRNA modification GTPase
VVRVSGRGLLPLARALTGKTPRPREAMRAGFLAADGGPIDDGLLLYFPAPHSFTGEDVVELHGHGGPVVLQMLLERCLDLGARLAAPGEFTRRAYLNGKLDLAQAEAVIDLIDASTQAAARGAARSLQGEFSREVRDLAARLIEARAQAEAALDFPEEDIDAFDTPGAIIQIERLRADAARLIARARQGRLLQAGIDVVLAGRPNVGKSSLLNRLTGEDLAIVTPVAGTTRDAVRGQMQIEGVPLRLIDTAGLREAGDEVERIGVERARREIENADVVVVLVDARQGVSEADAEILARLPPGPAKIVAHNKIDLAGRPPERRDAADGPAVWLSAKTGEGIELLERELLRAAGWTPGEGEHIFAARERHLRALAAALAHLETAAARLPRLELFAEELRLAQKSLDEIVGEFSSDDLLGEIFGRFCIGK